MPLQIITHLDVYYEVHEVTLISPSLNIGVDIHIYWLRWLNVISIDILFFVKLNWKYICIAKHSSIYLSLSIFVCIFHILSLKLSRKQKVRFKCRGCSLRIVKNQPCVGLKKENYTKRIALLNEGYLWCPCDCFISRHCCRKKRSTQTKQSAFTYSASVTDLGCLVNTLGLFMFALTISLCTWTCVCSVVDDVVFG